MVDDMNIKLSKQDWLKHGLESLSYGGYEALKADSMANKLGVSRGSFYWHFKNISAFHEELLEFWKQQSTSLVIEELDQTVLAKDRINVLIKRGFSLNTKLEREFRFWANQNDNVANFIQEIDFQRESYLVELFKLSNFPQVLAESRAQILYWAYLGRMLSLDKYSPQIKLDLTDELIRMFTQSD